MRNTRYIRQKNFHFGWFEAPGYEISNTVYWSLLLGTWCEYILKVIINISFDDLQTLAEIDKWGIDIFRIAELSDNKPLTAVAYTVFQVSFLIPFYLSTISFSRSID